MNFINVTDINNNLLEVKINNINELLSNGFPEKGQQITTFYGETYPFHSYHYFNPEENVYFLNDECFSQLEFKEIFIKKAEILLSAIAHLNVYDLNTYYNECIILNSIRIFFNISLNRFFKSNDINIEFKKQDNLSLTEIKNICNDLISFSFLDSRLISVRRILLNLMYCLDSEVNTSYTPISENEDCFLNYYSNLQSIVSLEFSNIYSLSKNVKTIIFK